MMVLAHHHWRTGQRPVPTIAKKNPDLLKKNIVIILVVLFAVIGLFMVFYFFEPTADSFYPKCPFHSLTGLQCPGCGTLRGLHALSHGHLIEAFRLNALMVIALLIAALGGLIEFKLISKSSSLNFCFQRIIRWRYVAVVTVIWWVLRNLIGC